jgi:hypothetical protein
MVETVNTIIIARRGAEDAEKKMPAVKLYIFVVS